MSVNCVPTLGWTRGGVAATIRLVTQEQRNDIAARIRAEMERQGLSSVRLARKADVSDKTVSRLINAQRDPRYDTLERVAKALGITEAELRGQAAGETPDLSIRPDLEAQLAALTRMVSELSAQLHDMQVAQGAATASVVEVMRLLDDRLPPIRESQRRRQQ